MGLTLQAVDVAGPCRWRWLLLDERSGVRLAEHLVELNPDVAETEAFEDLYRFLRWRADPDRRVVSEAGLALRVGAWIGSAVLGKRIGQAIATAAPVTVRVVVPPEAGFLAFRPLELAHIGGVPLAARGDVALVYDLASPAGVYAMAGPAGMAKAPVGAALRMLAVFSLPTATSTSGLRRERYELSRLLRRIAARGRRRVELEVAQYGLTRTMLRELAQSEDGWDVLHVSGHSGAGYFLLQGADGSADPVSVTELAELLRPLRSRVKLAVVSAGQSSVATTAETLRWLGLSDPAADLEVHAALEATASPVTAARALMAELGCAVVVMRYPVVEDFAAGFAEALYDRLFRNVQHLDRAVAAAVADAAGPAPSSGRPAISVATPAIFGASAIKLLLAPPVGKPVADPAHEAMDWFPPEPPRFVGRVEVMEAASAALTPGSSRTTVVLQGVAGVGKSTCAVELAYRHRRVFTALAYWSAPTDPDQIDDALRLLVVALDAQLRDYGLAMVDRIATPERLERFLPTLTSALGAARLLLVLDNLDSLLTPDGQWQDARWGPLIGALSGHTGLSRVIVTSRIVPAGLNLDTALVRQVPALSRDESLLLARELPHLRALLHAEPIPDGPGPVDSARGRRLFTHAQGHPRLLELADAAAADPVQLAAVDAAAGTGAQTLTAWTIAAVARLSTPARLLLQILCRIEETDRSTAVLRVTWPALWRRLERPGAPPLLATSVATLVSAALIDADAIDDPADPNGSVRYRIPASVTDVVQAATPEPITAAVDVQLAAWWSAVGDWAIEQGRAGKDTHQLIVRASLTAAHYLLRRDDWDGASCLIERALLQDHYALATALAAIPPLRRIAQATGALKDLVVLAAALRKLDPTEAETLLRRAYDQASAEGDYRLASATAGDLINLLRDHSRLREALTLAEQKIEHTRQAGLGAWTQLSDQGRRLQLLGMLGEHEQVLADVPALRARMADLPDHPADNDRVNPWNVREGILEVSRCSAVALQRWEEARNLNDKIAAVKRRRGASPYETACTRFNNYVPLLRLGRLADVDQLLRDCQDVFAAVGDMTQLAVVYAARADLEDKRDHPQDAADLQRTALRLRYVHPEPGEISTAHHHLANYLSRAGGEPAEQRAHRLTAALLNHLTGDTRELARTLSVLASELRSDSTGPDAPVLPTTLPEITRLVDAGDGVRFGKLTATLCPDLTTAGLALADLLATAAASADQQADHEQVETNRLLAAWEPIITAVGAAAADGATPIELTDLLDDVATTDWAALVLALRRVLAGERHREQLLTGLDTVGTAVLTATLDRLALHPQPEPEPESES